MKTIRIAVVSALMIAAVVFASLSLAGPAVRQYGPFPSTSPDSGTCGNDWAEDSFDRHFKVNTSPNPDGTYTVVEEFKKGTFVTNLGPSPGGCETNLGGTVAAGLTGKMDGSFTIIVSGGNFNPNGTCPAVCTTKGFIASVFGPTATYDIPTFLFHYNANNNGDWKNASSNRGGDRGDITGGP
ncbi:MAG: hypothetical protein DMF71_06990 [Acidobacteria bacterium]|nr:MAG: hypothetical protein DMF71_06990 [Acidobacteriota bacterium]